MPLSGSRLPDGGLDGFFALGYEDAVLKLYAPTVRQAVDEFPVAFAEMAHALDDEPGLEPAPQNAIAAAVEDVVAAWLRESLSKGGVDVVDASGLTRWCGCAASRPAATARSSRSRSLPAGLGRRCTYTTSTIQDAS